MTPTNARRLSIGASAGILVVLLIAPVGAPIGSPSPGRATLTALFGPSHATPDAAILSQAASAPGSQPDAIAGPFNGHYLNVAPYAANHSVSGSLMAVDGAHQVVYAANSFAGTVVSLDALSGRQLRSTSLFDEASPTIGGTQFTSIAFDQPDQLVIVGLSSPFGGAAGQLAFLDATTLSPLRVVDALPGGVAFDPCAFALDPVTDRVFVEDALGPAVAVFNASTGGFVGSPTMNSSFVPPTACYSWTGLVLLSDLRELVLGVAGLGQSVTIDTGSLAILPGPALPPSFVVSEGLFDPEDGQIWLANGSGSDIGLFSPATGQLTSTLPLPFQVVALAWDDGTGSAVATGWDTSTAGGQEVAAIDGASHSMVAEMRVNAGSTWLPLSDLVVESRPALPTWLLLSGATGATAQLLQLSSSPRSISAVTSFLGYPGSQLSVASDSGLGLTVIETAVPGAVTAYNETTQALVWTTPLAPDGWPYALSVDPLKHRIYVGVALVGFLATGIEVLDGGNGSVLGTVNASGLIGLSVDPVHERLYAITNPGTLSCTVDIFSIAAPLPSLVGGDSLPVCSESIVADPVYDAAFAVLYDGRVATVYGANQTLGPVYVFGGLFSLAIDVRADGQLVVGDSATSMVSVLDPVTGSFTTTFPTGSFGPDVVSEDPSLGLLFVANFSLPIVKVFNDTTGSALGSFATADATSEGAVDRVSGTFVTINLNRGDRTVVSLASLPSVPSPPSLIPGNGTLTVRWFAPTANPPVTGYAVLLSSSASGPVTVAASTSGSESLLENLTNGQTYYVSVQATNALGTGDPSSPSAAVPASVPFPPNLVRVTSSGASWIALAWSAPSSDGGSPISNYSVEYQSPGTLLQESQAGPATSVTIQNLSADTDYTIVIVAHNSVGASNPSAPIAAHTATLPSTASAYISWWALGGVLAIVIVTVTALVVYARRCGRRPALERPGRP